MKRLFHRILALLLAVSMMMSFAVTAYAVEPSGVTPTEIQTEADKTGTNAASSPKVTLSVSNTQVDPDGDITVSISLDQAFSGILAYQFDLYYNVDDFTFQSSAGNAAVSPYAKVGVDKTDKDGKHLVSVYLENTTGDDVSVAAGVLGTVTFTAKDTVGEVKTGSFQIGYSEAVNLNGDDLPCDVDTTALEVQIGHEVQPRTVRVYINDADLGCEEYLSLPTTAGQATENGSYISSRGVGVYTAPYDADGTIQCSPVGEVKADENNRYYYEYSLMPGTYYSYTGSDLEYFKTIDEWNYYNYLNLYQMNRSTFTVEEGEGVQEIDISLSHRVIYFTLGDLEDSVGTKMTSAPRVGYYYPAFEENTRNTSGSGSDLIYKAKEIKPDENGVYAVPMGVKILVDFGDDAGNLQMDGETYALSSVQMSYQFNNYGTLQQSTSNLSKLSQSSNLLDALDSAGMDGYSSGLYTTSLDQGRICDNTTDAPALINATWAKSENVLYSTLFVVNDKYQDYDSAAAAVKSVTINGAQTAARDNGENNSWRLCYPGYAGKNSTATVAITLHAGYFLEAASLAENVTETPNADGTTTYTYAETVGTSNVENTVMLYATQGVSGTITFSANGGSTPEAMTVEPATPIAVSSLPTSFYPDNQFLGWYKDSAFQNPWTDEDQISYGDLSITLYAKWEKAIVGTGRGSLYVSSNTGMAEVVLANSVSQISTFKITGIPAGYRFSKLTSSYGSDPALEENVNYWIRPVTEESGNVTAVYVDVQINKAMVSTDGADVVRIAAQFKNAKTDLQTAIQTATTSLAAAKISVGGTDVLAVDQWTTQAVHETYSAAIDAANTALAGAETGYIAACDTLAAATTAFEAEKQSGTRVDEYFNIAACQTAVTLEQTGDIANGDVQYQTADAVIAALPRTATVTLKNSEGEDSGTRTIPITWADTDGYHAAVGGFYTFTAAFTLPLDVMNSDGVAAPTVEVEVLAEPAYACPIDFAAYMQGGNSSMPKIYVLGDKTLGFAQDFAKETFQYDLTGSFSAAGFYYNIALKPGYTATLTSSLGNATATSSSYSGSLNVSSGDTVTITVMAPAGVRERNAVYTLKLGGFETMSVYTGVSQSIEGTDQSGYTMINGAANTSVSVPQKDAETVPTVQFVPVSDEPAKVAIWIQSTSAKAVTLVSVNGVACNQALTKDANSTYSVSIDRDMEKSVNTVSVEFQDNAGTVYSQTFEILSQSAVPVRDPSIITLGLADNNSHSFYSYNKATGADWGAAVLPATASDTSLTLKVNPNLDTTGLSFVYNGKTYTGTGTSFTLFSLRNMTSLTVRNVLDSDNATYDEKTVPIQYTTASTAANPGIILQSTGELARQLVGGTEDTLTVIGTAKDAAKTVTYQWYSCTNASRANPTAVKGATAASFAIPTDTAGTYYYYCAASASGETDALSCLYTATVNTAPTIDKVLVYTENWGTLLNASADVKNGDTIEVPQGTEKVWLRLISSQAGTIRVNEVAAVRGTGLFTLKNVAVSGDTALEIKAANVNNDALVSNLAITLKPVASVTPTLGVNVQPSDAAISMGNTATLYASAIFIPGSDAAITAQWYACNADGMEEAAIPGATSNSYQTATDIAAPQDFYYFCRFSSGSASEDSKIAKVSVSYPEISKINASFSVLLSSGQFLNRATATNQTIQLSLKKGSGDLAALLEKAGATATYQWYYGKYASYNTTDNKIPIGEKKTFTTLSAVIASFDASQLELGQYYFWIEITPERTYEDTNTTTCFVQHGTVLSSSKYSFTMMNTVAPTYADYKALVDELTVYMNGTAISGVSGVGMLVDALTASAVPKYQYFSLGISNATLLNTVGNAKNCCTTEAAFNSRSPADLFNYYTKLLDIKAKLQGDNPAYMAVQGAKNSAPIQLYSLSNWGTFTGEVGNEVEIQLKTTVNGEEKFLFQDPDVATGCEAYKPLTYYYTTGNDATMIPFEGDSFKYTPTEAGTILFKVYASDGEYSSATAQWLKITATDTVTPVIEAIDAIGTVTRNSEAAISAARTAFDALTDGQKALVSNEAALTAAETSLANLKAAKTVEDQITALPAPIALTDEAAITAARTAFDALTDGQ
ncbi:MAG: InlB B-repeat-containing protein, partial [Oscillospiraceae bacterium]|nr:InlB B-repeat-containing protein [Oscillospiraceae bacterium]